MTNFEFHTPWAFVLLLFLPVLYLVHRRDNSPGLKIPGVSGHTSFREPFGIKFLRWTKYLIFILLTFAMARPQSFRIVDNPDENKGIDILFSVDVSLSMLAQDLEPDRLSALKSIARDFVKQRPYDRLGLVAYSGEAFLKVPLTMDHDVLDVEIQGLSTNELVPGTAIGEGLGLAVKHLQKSKSKSKVIILMTDGVNTIENAMPPQVGAELARSAGIKVYTIGIGTNGFARFPIGFDFFGDLQFIEQEVKIDEATLSEIAQLTGGKYFRATSAKSLQEVYQTINTLEKSAINQPRNYSYTEYYRYPLFGALALLLLDLLLRWIGYKNPL